MDLALNDLQRLICRKTQQTNKPLINLIVWLLFGFYGISIFVGYLMPNPFLYK